MYGKQSTAPCGHAGEHVIGNYVRCLIGCDSVTAHQPEVVHNKTNFGRLNSDAIADYYQKRLTKRPQPAPAPASFIALPHAPLTTNCRKCCRSIPFLGMGGITPTKAIYECPTCTTPRGQKGIRTILQGPYQKP